MQVLWCGKCDIPPNLVVEWLGRSLEATRSQDLQVAEPIICG